VNRNAKWPESKKGLVEDFTQEYQWAVDLSHAEPEDDFIRRQIAAGFADGEIIIGLRTSSRERWWHKARIGAWRQHAIDAGLRPWEHAGDTTPPPANDATTAPADEGPTAYAVAMIPKVSAAFHEMGRPSKRGAADLAGVSRDTVDDWIRRGWMNWPPNRADEIRQG
jgi:hypothetical protein